MWISASRFSTAPESTARALLSAGRGNRPALAWLIPRWFPPPSRALAWSRSAPLERGRANLRGPFHLVVETFGFGLVRNRSAGQAIDDAVRHGHHEHGAEYSSHGPTVHALGALIVTT